VVERCTDPADRVIAEKALRLGMVKGDPLQAIDLLRSMDDRQEASQLIAAAAASAAKMGPGVLRRLATVADAILVVFFSDQSRGQKDPELAVDLALNQLRTQMPHTLRAMRSVCWRNETPPRR